MIKARDNFALPQALEQYQLYICIFSTRKKIAQAVNFPLANKLSIHVPRVLHMKGELIIRMAYGLMVHGILLIS
jgi:hypothetical protein